MIDRKWIITNAVEVINELGFVGATAREIALRCNMSKSNLFYHFESLPALYRAIFDYYKACLEEEIYNDLNQNWGIKRKLDHLFKARGRWGLRNPNAVRFMFAYFAIKGMNHIAEYDKELFKMIGQGVRAKIFIDYQTTHIATLFFATSNAITLSLVEQGFSEKKKITILNKSFESFFDSIINPDPNSDQIDQDYYNTNR